MKEIVFDRASGALDAPDGRARLQARLMRYSHQALAPFGYLGISRVHGALNALLRPDTDTVVAEGPWRFLFPSGDYYWNRLLDPSYDYEPEIGRALAQFADVDFTFVDLGANFGFWSSKVAAGLYGEHRVVAVEASSYCLGILQRNLAERDAAVHHRAIDESSGTQIALFGGPRHAGQSIDESWSGASHEVVDRIETISIDDLVALEGIDPEVTPLVVKLDVEGVELRAFRGARRTVAGQSLWLIEDAAPNDVSPATVFARDELGMHMFIDDGKRLTELTSWEQLVAYKRTLTAFQAAGVNLLASASPSWIDALRKGWS